MLVFYLSGRSPCCFALLSPFGWLVVFCFLLLVVVGCFVSSGSCLFCLFLGAALGGCFGVCGLLFSLLCFVLILVWILILLCCAPLPCEEFLSVLMNYQKKKKGRNVDTK